MNMEDNDLKIFEETLKDYLHNPIVEQMKNYKAHGKKDVYTHCIDVAKMAYQLNDKFSLNADLNTLLIGALLHDFYLYDWHDAPINTKLFEMHGYTHAKIAKENAVKYFDIDEDVQKVIECHMWPLTLRSFPNSKEAFIVSVADKICALKETFKR